MTNVHADANSTRAAFEARHGYWSPAFDLIIEGDPEYFAAYAKIAAVPYERNELDPKVREFVLIALNATVPWLHEPSVRAHIEIALRLGAHKNEILEVLELTSILGIHSCNVGIPILLEELERAGKLADQPSEISQEERERLKQRFEGLRGFWSPQWDELLDLSPSFFEAYTEFSSHPWLNGSLSPKAKELVYIAIDSVVTHLYEPGLRAHVRNALNCGATATEIMSVFELASLIGMHSCTLGAPILEETLERLAKAEDR
jgi:alkylhydroperoxidase/carboxymuconolactone decarboxylase family protein YurZ